MDLGIHFGEGCVLGGDGSSWDGGSVNRRYLTLALIERLRRFGIGPDTVAAVCDRRGFRMWVTYGLSGIGPPGRCPIGEPPMPRRKLVEAGHRTARVDLGNLFWGRLYVGW